MKEYQVPLELFDCDSYEIPQDETLIEKDRKTIQGVLSGHEIKAEVSVAAIGPRVTTFNVVAVENILPKRLLRFEHDFALNLGGRIIRAYVNPTLDGIYIEVPNKDRETVKLGNLLEMEEMDGQNAGELRFILGKDTRNRIVTGDFTKVVNMLIGGYSGSGKTVFIHSIIASLLYKHSPKDVRFIFIDTKMVEFMLYNGLPHLITGRPITDANEGILALDWAIHEMERRYRLFEKMSYEGQYVVNIDQYNQHVKDEKDHLPKIVIVIDEFADLMYENKRLAEEKLQQLLLKARAAGIHVIVSTQRVSPSILTGVVKMGFRSHFAFSVACSVDSRMILDREGGEKLLGQGDYLYSCPVFDGIERMQAPHISNTNILKLVSYIRENYPVEQEESMEKLLKEIRTESEKENEEEIEPVYIEALKIVAETGVASISMIQRKCSTGYNKAGKIVDWMERKGYISGFDGARGRNVLITKEDFEKEFGDKGVTPEYIETLKFAVENGSISVAILQRRFGMSLQQATKIVEWMESKGYVSNFDGMNPRKVLMTMEEFEETFHK